MKTIITLIVFFFYSYAMTAQHNYTIQEGQAPGNGLSKSFTTTLTGFQLDFVESEWRCFLLQYGSKSENTIKNGEAVQIDSENMVFPVLDNEQVDIMAEIRPIPNNEGLDSVSLTIWIVRDNQTYLDPKTDEDSAAKIKDWLVLFDKQLDANCITKD